MRRRKLGALARRYGHASMKQFEEATASIRRIARENPLPVAAIIGGGVGAIAAGMGAGTAAILGAGAGIAFEEISKK